MRCAPCGDVHDSLSACRPRAGGVIVRAAELIAAGGAEAEQLGMTRDRVRFEHLEQHLHSEA